MRVHKPDVKLPKLVGRLAGAVRQLQTGHLYQYALVMALGIFGLLTWQLWPYFSGLMR